MNWTPAVNRLADAITKAEGSNPEWNNPGDMTINPFNAPTLGIANSEGVLKFAKFQDGRDALCHQCSLMLTGMSHVYRLNMSFAATGSEYADGDANWGKNVAAFLGVPESTTLQQWRDTFNASLPTNLVSDPELGM